jgi:hypothetical protein
VPVFPIIEQLTSQKGGNENVIEDVKFRLMERIEKALLRKGNKIGHKRTSEQTVICEEIKAFVLY